MTAVRPRIDRLRHASGAFAMVALDQRESLRAMLQAARGGDPGAAEVAAFKVAATRLLSPHASAVLLDLATGLEPVRAAGALDPSSALIVAADRLCQPRGTAVLATGLDVEPFDAAAIAARADAFKLLVLWHPDRGRARRERLVSAFLERCRRAGRPGIVEGIVRPPRRGGRPPDHAEAVVAAAQELGALQPDLYKAEVPTHGRGGPGEVVAASRAITAALPCPWVVLSNGVDPAVFDDAAAAACEGGASGFLAGRAIWTASLSAPVIADHLESVAAPRLAALVARVGSIVASQGRRGEEP